MRRLTVTSVGIGWMFAAMGSVVGAQPNERRRDCLEGVLRVLVETQVLPQSARDSQPPQGKPPAPRPPADPRYRESRAVVEEFSAQAGELVDSLRQEERARPELRPLLADAMAVKAMTDALLRRTELQPDLALMADGFSSVDQHWRTLATRLEGSFAVSGACRQSIRQLSECSSRVCQRLGIRPQVDQDELVRLLAALTGYLRGLQDEIANVSQRSRDNQVLWRDGQRLEVLVNLLIASANRRCPYDECLNQYQSLHKNWLAWADRLRSLEVRDAERYVRRIKHVHRQLHDVLWIPFELNRAGLTRDAQLLSRSVDATCERISLTMLLAMPDAASVVEAARELQSLCQDFQRAAAGQDSLDSLRWDFRPLDVQWQQFCSCFRDPISPELSPQLALVDENI